MNQFQGPFLKIWFGYVPLVAQEAAFAHLASTYPGSSCVYAESGSTGEKESTDIFRWWEAFVAPQN
jgi:hypothetical protein